MPFLVLRNPQETYFVNSALKAFEIFYEKLLAESQVYSVATKFIL